MPPLPPTIEGCHALLKDFYNLILILQQEVGDLKGIVSQTSSNTHRPPSQDGFKKIAPVLRGKGSKKGGQTGHIGKTLKMVATPDVIAPHYPEVCRGCGAALSDQVMAACERRQVFDLPAPRLFVTEHQIFSCTCGCGRRNFGDFPATVAAPVQYGSHARAFASLLNQSYLLPFDKISDLFEDLFAQPMNVSTIISSNETLYDALEHTEAAIKKQIENSAVVHFDETGLPINGQLNWLHTASTDKLTYYFVHPKRGTPALRDKASVLPNFTGYAIHDCWASYFKFDACQHGLCNAHLLRELQAALDNGYDWAAILQNQLKELLNLKNQQQITEKHYQDAKKNISDISQKAQQDIQTQRDKQGNLSKIQKKTLALLKRIQTQIDKFLAFASCQYVPFSNNQAERDIRMVKLKTKISGGFRTEKGARIFARIRGVIASYRKHDINVFKQIQQAISKNTNYAYWC